ncbi:His-Xaa-Ser system-associated MauG-like protein [Halomonas piscis]|uniref:His-Xaa-Ser system-associated MauG-like protein n=1 Tax=Halomonas piscis TaxID=3031727 RepID=UPI00289F6BF6|nr:His-Xaa-Ser system-associated MauG-like protein [Halomonas piscis]
MKRHLSLLFCILPTSAWGLSLDDRIDLIVDTYNLEPEICTGNIDSVASDNRDTIGRIFFESTALSGNNDVACQTCHLDNRALSDGLPVAVGVGGSGEGAERMHSGGVLVKRNAFSLFGRSSTNYQNFFWDGRVGENEGKIFSPIGNGYNYGFSSPLSVAAVIPLLARDEFLGELDHFDQNEMLRSVNGEYYQERYRAANNYFENLFDEPMSPSISQLANSLRDEGANIANIDLPYIGNSLASFISSSSENCEPSGWERYLQGERRALTNSQKQGALVFYGQGRCAACHSGSLFSDFDFHSIGTPQGSFGVHMHQQDMGLGGVTFQNEDRYLFRTPPLLRVSETAPYGHNGTFESLEDVVLYHINPIPFFVDNGWENTRDKFTHGGILSKRDDILGYISIDSDSEFNNLIDFLKSL